MSELSPYSRFLIDSGVKGIPLDLTIELTGKCNFDCVHCFNRDLEGEDRLRTPRLLELLEEIKEMGGLYLSLTGGEALLGQTWEEIIPRARQLGFKVNLLTNASKVDDAIARRLASFHITVEVSLYSMQEDVFERVTRRKGSFAATLRGIETLRTYGVDILLKMPLMTLNTGGYREVFDFACQAGVDCQAYPTIFKKRDGSATPLHFRPPDEAFSDFYREHEDAPPLLLEPARHESRPGPLCAAGARMAYITSAGDVLACPNLPEVAGNILNDSFKHVWETAFFFKRLRAIRRNDLRECSSCRKISYCGRCPAQALLEDGDLLGPSRRACEHAAALERAFGMDAAK